MVKQLKVDPWDTCEVTTESQRDSRNAIQQNRLNASVDIQSDYAEILNKSDAKFTGDVFYQENGFAFTQRPSSTST